MGLGEGSEQVRLSSSPLRVSCFEDPPGLGFAMGQQLVPLVGQGSPPGLLGIPSGPRGEASSLPELHQWSSPVGLPGMPHFPRASDFRRARPC